MRVARASSGPKIPRRKRHRIYELEYLAFFGRNHASVDRRRNNKERLNLNEQPLKKAMPALL
jgi:hypothetical protein